MYGDSGVMRDRYRALRAQGEELRALADRLVADAAGLAASGRAAAALDDRVRARAADLREVAARHDVAADVLDTHLREVDRLRETIAGIEQRAGALVTEARTRLDRAARPGIRLVPDPEDEEIAAFVPPPSGHRDWLAVELPGL